MALARSNDSPPRVRNLIAFSTFIMLLFGIIVLFQAFREYDIATQRGKANAERLVEILSDQISLSFHTVDLVLQRAVERQYLNLLFGEHLPEDVSHNFNYWVKQTPPIVAMLLVNERGDIELGVADEKYEGWIDYATSMARSEPFLALKRNEDVDMYLNPYLDAYGKPTNLILMSRKISKLNGTFGGMVVAAVPAEFFLDFFQSIDSGAARYMSLFLKDGRNLFAAAAHERTNNAMIEPVKQKLLEGKQEPKAATLMEESGGSIRLISYEYLQRLPLIVAVIVDEDDFLSGFWEERFKDLSFLTIFLVLGSVLSFFALTMARQITRVEESEAAAILASQAKSEFLANMSHELRTPLNAIIGFSEMLTSGYFGQLNAKQKERVNDINLCGNHLLHLISDILEFSKGEAGKLELVEERCNAGDIVDEVARMMGEKIKSKGVSLTIDVAKGLPRIFADKRKIKQILINLISNAIKFTPQDGDIKISARLDANGAMNLVVSDTGIGIAEEDIPTALSVFGQVHRSKSHEGTGLGLPLCRMFTELHGGKLTLVSVVGEGTTVRVILPADRVILDENAA